MNTRNLIVSLTIIFPYYLIGAEPSAFGAGDLSNPNPYGLTSTEATILETKKNLNKIVVKSNNQANEVDSLRERIDGLQTIIESLSSSSRENKLKVKSLTDEYTLQRNNESEYSKRIAESLQDNSKEIEKIKLQIIEMSKIIDQISSTYILKTEFNALVSDVNKFKDLVAKELKTGNTKSKKTKNENMSTSEIESKAKSLYDKKQYDESLEYYKDLIAKNYKPAYCHYMVGEIEYYKNSYAEAIAYYKKSASLFNKASYMPTLMLHTAISMDKTGDKKNAKIFYDAVVSQFSDSSQAKIAKSKLSSIKQ
ncbi:MAG: hypothetical protein A2513_08510 [Sulfurimonas sp. RIFOXYD12_FULL_33_39]|uniref:tetratricopeptide repeat protein n=1 Tax=unclassified Sulfurimonas TaxID=2623549 RepID=UPI0008B14315|nr:MULTISPECIES: tetratricopeptide repeat protein [unclassified Sulfurimonas]OHE01989.1 MAG: hypothetical protein A3G74_01605 [Sulfurimonas sp. RIFCSPLOWO2_12_FULL_34_6]OHE10126.1 MAG: hypothetical protein A2513_08510 [Sulfurimonas sp. RIFOXYD12_FULL_33_39]OHE14653.1 MAG: hypothetical protein A2530_01970 [Sulfurimonas sp. RIFOXYD2_FULL_34_21]